MVFSLDALHGRGWLRSSASRRGGRLEATIVHLVSFLLLEQPGHPTFSVATCSVVCIISFQCFKCLCMLSTLWPELSAGRVLLTRSAFLFTGCASWTRVAEVFCFTKRGSPGSHHCPPCFLSSLKTTRSSYIFRRHLLRGMYYFFSMFQMPLYLSTLWPELSAVPALRGRRFSFLNWKC